MREFKMGSFNFACIFKHYEEFQILMEKQPLDFVIGN